METQVLDQILQNDEVRLELRAIHVIAGLEIQTSGDLENAGSDLRIRHRQSEDGDWQDATILQVDQQISDL